LQGKKERREEIEEEGREERNGERKEYHFFMCVIKNPL
jgi:hypothetical protein